MTTQLQVFRIIGHRSGHVTHILYSLEVMPPSGFSFSFSKEVVISSLLTSSVGPRGDNVSLKAFQYTGWSTSLQSFNIWNVLGMHLHFILKMSLPLAWFFFLSCREQRIINTDLFQKQAIQKYNSKRHENAKTKMKRWLLVTLIVIALVLQIE